MLVRAATRGSVLARWQADHIARLLARADRSVTVEPVIVSTHADRRQDLPIHALGGKGMFVKEVQAAVLDGRADLAVHSAKDLPAVTAPGLVLAAVPVRGDIRDALVGCRLGDLPDSARVATGSIRRRVQLSALRPDLRFFELRGNIGTRLDKAGGFDAILVAAAALERLGASPGVVDVLDPEVMVPQVGQGALAVECRADDAPLRERLAALEHAPTRLAVDAERAYLEELGGDCDLPAGAYATVDSASVITLTAVLARDVAPGEEVFRASDSGRAARPLGQRLARQLRNRLEA